jgi:broad specificity phosphatase PhoE
MQDDERYLILIRHSQSQPLPGIDAQRWPLAVEGRERAAALPPRLAPYRPGIIFSSYERKAVQTAQVVAHALTLPYVLWPGLHEHDRTAIPYYDRETFLTLVQRFFDRPDELIFGHESASAALNRFQLALDDLLDAYPRRTVAAVSHGTVLTLFLAPRAKVDPFRLWQRMGQPAFAVLQRPGLELVEMVEKL